ncbi:unnamed protein product [Lactuca saligna]|uniref:Protein kinase domain-containing protein n=1 Tax=Lactuca saligna TaxID=75948 RepID=A0AA36EBF5_LACSI|nr:unnamed protein product [Lactuca saligna]
MEQYQILKEIGSGSYGVVWGAWDEHTDEVFAIKKLKMRCNSAKEYINLTEVKALRKMNHPNIIKLKEIIKEDDSLYLVLEYMECNLCERMTCRKKPFSEDEIRDLCFQIFQGLAYMHDNGYFHRDLKPENLLVSKDVIKIADLGLAREMNGKPATDNIGSRWYSAPEVLLGKEYDSSVDMWAMGAIMAELFTRHPLFPGKHDRDQMYKICRVIGSPTETTLSMVNSNYQFPQLPGVQLSSLLPCASLEALDLIAMLISWNPSARPTAMEALEHPFFYTCYHVPPPRPIPLVFKSSKSCAFSYEREDQSKELIRLLPENPFYETVVPSENMTRLLPENPLYDSEVVDHSENFRRLLPENMFDGSEKEDPSEKHGLEMKRDSLKLKTRTKNCTIGLESDARHIDSDSIYG